MTPAAPIPRLQRRKQQLLQKDPLPKPPTPERRRGYRASLAARRRRLGMFAVVDTAESFEEREARLHRERVAAHRAGRQRLARDWRAARSAYRALPEELRRQVAERWNRLPADTLSPTTLLVLVHDCAPRPAPPPERPPEGLHLRHTVCDAPLSPWTIADYWRCTGCGTHFRGEAATREAAQRGEIRVAGVHQTELRLG